MSTSPVGKTTFPFDDLDELIDEEQALPAIPHFPSIWTLNKRETELPEKQIK